MPRPGKVIAVGLNYHDHAKEGGMELPTSPMLFAKFSTSVIGHGDTIEWDPDLTAAVDLEAELGVVIGTTARRVSEADALDHVSATRASTTCRRATSSSRTSSSYARSRSTRSARWALSS